MKGSFYTIRVIVEGNETEGSHSMDFCADCLDVANDLLSSADLDSDGWPTITEGELCDSAIDEGYKCEHCKRIFKGFGDRT